MELVDRMRWPKRAFSAVLLWLLAAQTVTAAPAYRTLWNVLKIGAGGWITGLDIANDGTKFVRADTYGAWLHEPAEGDWRQCVTINSMPQEMAGIDLARGVYEAAIAPNGGNRLYMLLAGHLFRSNDGCKTWELTKFPRDIARLRECLS